MTNNQYSCPKCGNNFDRHFSANEICICPNCKIVIGSECEYGFGPIAPCEIYLGNEKLGEITRKENLKYHLTAELLDVGMDLEKGYGNLEVYQEATSILKNKLVKVSQ